MSNLTRPEIQALIRKHREEILRIDPKFDGRSSNIVLLEALRSIGVGGSLKKSPRRSPKKNSPKKSPKKSSPKKSPKQSPKKGSPKKTPTPHQPPFEKEHPVLNDRWLIEELLGKGGEGVVYRAIDEETIYSVAVKFFLRYGDWEIYIITTFYPERFFDSGTTNYEGKKVQFLVMPLYFRTLSEQHLLSGAFTRAYVNRLVPSMMGEVERLHSNGYISRDIKPSNFMFVSEPLPKERKLQVVMIDFGLATPWRHPDGSHIAYRTDNPFKGTYRYASVNAHFKIEQSRRDDLESLFYTLVSLFNPPLPWALPDLKDKKKAQVNKIVGEEKKLYPESDHFKALPSGYQEYYHIVRKMGFEEEPSYKHLQSLLLRK